MCMVVDAAMTMVNRAIDLAEKTGDNSYYLDYIAVHKLLFLCQHKMLHDFGLPMFEEDVYAHTCGPYIDELNFLPLQKGTSKITEPYEETEIVPMTYKRIVVMDAILREYGKLSTEEIVRQVKESKLYTELTSKITDENKPCIEKSRMMSKVDKTINKEAINKYIEERTL